MFSDRSHVHPVPNALSLAVDERRRRGLPVVDLTLSNPTQAGFTYAHERLLRALSSSAALSYEPDPMGILGARAAVSSETGFPDVSRIMLTASTSEAYSFLFKLLCNAGDDVLVPVPSYPLFTHLATLEHVHITPYRLFYDGAWHIDLDELRRKISSRTRAIITVSPNNPTGSFLKKRELEAIAALGKPIISDEVFAPYALRDDGDRARTALLQDGALTFAMGGLSKFAGLPQMKLAWTLVGGPASQVKPALERLELIADTFLSVSAPVQHALPVFLDEGRALQAQIRTRTAHNLAAARALLRREDPVSILDVEGGWVVTLRLPRIHSDEEWALRLLDDGVLVQPGYFYDFEQDALIVLSLLTPPDLFSDGLARILRRARDDVSFPDGAPTGK